MFPLLEEEFQLPLVIATTGEKEKLIEKLNELSHNMPVFFSANMSYGVHALTKILEAAIPLLQDYDIELTEAHHNKKVDAPSGTLVKLYDVIKTYAKISHQFMIDMNLQNNALKTKLAFTQFVVGLL